MKFTKFKIKDFKGIKNAEVSLDTGQGARIITFVGLNEGGKTTLLEAIHSFSPDSDTQIVVGNVASVDEQRMQRVPRHRISDFTGNVSVTATLLFEAGDKVQFSRLLNKEGITLDTSEIPDEFEYERYSQYKNGDFVGAYYRCSLNWKIKTGRQRNYRDPTTSEQSTIVQKLISLFPIIAYFPTFVFNFPEKIYLTGRTKSKTNEYYAKLFQDILDYDGRGLKIEEHIISRLRKAEYQTLWSQFLTSWGQTNENDKIDQVVARASQAVTKIVFGKWNEVFNEDASDKEIVIEWGLDEGLEVTNDDGTKSESTQHDLYIKFRIKHGAEKFDIKDGAGIEDLLS